MNKAYISRGFFNLKKKKSAAYGVTVSPWMETAFCPEKRRGSEMVAWGLLFAPSLPLPSVTWSVLHLWLAAGCFALAEKCIVYFNADLWRFIHILNLLSPVAPVSLSLLLAFILFWLVLILYFAKRVGTYCPVGMIAKNLTAVSLPQKKYL